jgi:hypothetical protein
VLPVQGLGQLVLVQQPGQERPVPELALVRQQQVLVQLLLLLRSLQLPLPQLLQLQPLVPLPLRPLPPLAQQ